ncbi:hypothetical protein [Tardiphaga sp. 709]|uniref:hypothetical protein n=1 Tax=Tardiphaga sp. 709 TaxID=3076039 RepID=UPI0028E4206D|nr:hypothetical protein [Tardiphaga sp. 709]WNV09997.1 hypothetical protein RSO67_02010 [Tardiphaga sp. 709]
MSVVQFESPAWKVHTPNLLKEVLSNPSAAVLRQPMAILGRLLAAVAERASEINDPALNMLMLRLTLYDAADPLLHPQQEIDAVFKHVEAAMALTVKDRGAS